MSEHSRGLLVDTILLMIETEGPGISDVGPNGEPVYFYPVRDRVRPVLLQAVLMGFNPLEVYRAAVEKLGQDAPVLPLIFGRSFWDGKRALAELYWDQKKDGLDWMGAIHRPPDWDAFREVLAGAEAWGAESSVVYMVAKEHYPLNAVTPMVIWERVRPEWPNVPRRFYDPEGHQ
jgi:hypothetical protein